MRIPAREVAKLTGLSLRVVQKRAREIPGSAMLLGRWTFDAAEVQRWIDWEARACRATSTARPAAGSGTFARPSEAESIEKAYARLLGRSPRSERPSA